MIQLHLWGDIAGPVPHTLLPFVSSLFELIEVVGKKKAGST